MWKMELKDLNRIESPDGVLSNEVGCAIEKLFGCTEWSSEKDRKEEDVKLVLIDAYSVILANVPSSPSRTRALNCILDARMLANQALTFDGQV
jgi:hypothetical protein